MVFFDGTLIYRFVYLEEREGTLGILYFLVVEEGGGFGFESLGFLL